MRGKPIIRFSIGDVVSSDPVIGSPSFYWAATDEIEMADRILEISKMDERKYDKASKQAILYVRDYFVPVNDTALKYFT
jgi:hypothetical protein